MRSHNFSGGRLLLAFVLAVGLTALLVLGGTLLHLVLTREETPAPPPEQQQEELPTETDPWGGALLDIPRNELEEHDFSSEDGMVIYTGELDALTGIDVSSHQGEIDWAMVAESGVEFAIVQVGYRGYSSGALAADERFAENAQGAQENGIALGAYFFSQCLSVEEAREEALFVVDQLKGYDIRWPVIFDWEPVENSRTSEMDTSILTDCARTFCQILEHAGYRAGVYFNQIYGYQHYDLSRLQNYVFWLAEYDPYPSFSYDFDIWQYSCTGTLPGIETTVDLNLSFVDYG